MRQIEDQEDDEDIALTSHNNGSQKIVKESKMPCFEESKDDMDVYLHRSEVYAQSQGWKNDQWLCTITQGSGIRSLL